MHWILDWMYWILDMMTGLNMMYTMNIIYCKINKNPKTIPSIILNHVYPVQYPVHPLPCLTRIMILANLGV
jgi:hypothetical protein